MHSLWPSSPVHVHLHLGKVQLKLANKTRFWHHWDAKIKPSFLQMEQCCAPTRKITAALLTVSAPLLKSHLNNPVLPKQTFLSKSVTKTTMQWTDGYLQDSTGLTIHCIGWKAWSHGYLSGWPTNNCLHKQWSQASCILDADKNGHNWPKSERKTTGSQVVRTDVSFNI